jgi:hypothetical protein
MGVPCPSCPSSPTISCDARALADRAFARLDATENGFGAFCDLWEHGTGSFGL